MSCITAYQFNIVLDKFSLFPGAQLEGLLRLQYAQRESDEKFAIGWIKTVPLDTPPAVVSRLFRVALFEREIDEIGGVKGRGTKASCADVLAAKSKEENSIVEAEPSKTLPSGDQIC